MMMSRSYGQARWLVSVLELLNVRINSVDLLKTILRCSWFSVYRNSKKNKNLTLLLLFRYQHLSSIVLCSNNPRLPAFEGRRINFRTPRCPHCIRKASTHRNYQNKVMRVATHRNEYHNGDA